MYVGTNFWVTQAADSGAAILRNLIVKKSCHNQKVDK